MKFKRVIIYLLLVAHLPLSAQVDNWAVVRKGDMEGIIDLSNGKLVTSVIYDEVEPDENFIRVKKDGLVTLLDLTEGKEMFPLLYDYIQPMSSKYLRVSHNEIMGIIDYTGKEILPMIYKSVYYMGSDTYYLNTDTSCIVVNSDLEIIDTDCRTYERRNTKYVTYTVQEKKKDIYGQTQYRVGIKDIQTGEMVVPVKYRYINIFQERYFIVAANVIKGMVKDYGIVNIKGEEIAPMIYRNVRSFQNKDVALLSVPHDDDINFIIEVLPGNSANDDEDDEDSTDLFDEELAVSRFSETKDTRRLILMDVLTGDSIVPFDYDYVGEYNNPQQDIIVVGRDDKYGLFNLAERKEWAPCIYDKISTNKYSLYNYFNVRFGDKVGLIGPKGAMLDCKYDNILLARYFIYFTLTNKRGNEKCGLIDYDCNVLFPPVYDVINFDEYVLFLTKDERTIAINILTKEELPTVTYNERYYLKSNKPMIISEDERYGVIDGQTGRLIIPCEYNEISINGSYANTYSDNGPKIFDLETGNSIVPFDTEHIEILSNDYAIVMVDEKFGVYNYVEGKEVIPCKYEGIVSYLYDKIICQMDGKYGLIDIETEEVLIPFEYDNMTRYWDFFPP